MHHLDDQQHDISNSLGQFESHYPYWYRMKFFIWCRVTKEVQILQICLAANLPIVSRTVQYPLHYCNCIFDMSVAGTCDLNVHNTYFNKQYADALCKYIPESAHMHVTERHKLSVLSQYKTIILLWFNNSLYGYINVIHAYNQLRDLHRSCNAT